MCKREFYEPNSFELNAKSHKDSIFIIKNENEKPTKTIFIVYFRPEIRFRARKIELYGGKVNRKRKDWFSFRVKQHTESLRHDDLGLVENLDSRSKTNLCFFSYELCSYISSISVNYCLNRVMLFAHTSLMFTQDWENNIEWVSARTAADCASIAQTNRRTNHKL